MMKDSLQDLKSQTLNAVAEHVRRLLADYATALALPRGILGTALLRASGTTDAIVFAENVGPGWTVEKVADEQQQEQRSRAVHYTWPRFHPFVDCVASESDLCVLSSESARTTAGPQQYDVWDPLQRLFHGDVPESIKIHRAWLKDSHSVLYYIPENQESVPGQWIVFDSIRHIIGKGLRWPLVALAMHDRMVQAQPQIDAMMIARMLTCLPEQLEDFEHRLLDASKEHRAYRERLTNIVLRVSWDSYNKQIVIKACRETSRPTLVIIKRPAPTECGDSAARAKCEEPSKDWTDADGNTNMRMWIISILILRSVFANILPRLFPSPPADSAKRRVGRRARKGFEFSEETPQECLYSLVYERDQLLSAPGLGGKPDELPPELYLGDDGPSGSVEKARSISDSKVEKLERALLRADELLCDRLGVDSAQTKLICAKQLNHEKCYYLSLPVKYDESMRVPLSGLRQIFDHASPRPEDWPSRLLFRILGVD